MVGQQTIEIVIGPKGESVLQTRGFTGSTCRQGSQLLERALGDVASDLPTAEMHQPVRQDEHLRQH